jgi:hypothetical protein
MSAAPGINILQALDDPRLFASVVRGGPSWEPWRAFLAAFFALPMGEAGADLIANARGAPPILAPLLLRRGSCAAGAAARAS